MNANEKEQKLIWAINKARDENTTKPLLWAERNGAVKGSNARRDAYNLAMEGKYDEAIRRLE